MKSKYKKLKDELIKIAKACAPTPEDILVYMGRARRFASFLKESNIQIKSINSIKLRHIELYFQQRYRNWRPFKNTPRRIRHNKAYSH
ncbi:phage integrase N-terminal domain-containing protein [Escherichia coli]